jgi:hypothetical protein
MRVEMGQKAEENETAKENAGALFFLII